MATTKGHRQMILDPRIKEGKKALDLKLLNSLKERKDIFHTI